MEVSTHVSDLERIDVRRHKKYGAKQRVSVILRGSDAEISLLQQGDYQSPSVMSRVITKLWAELRARHEAGTFPSFSDGYGSTSLDTYTHTEQAGRAYWVTFTAWVEAERPSEIVDQDEALALMGGVEGLQALVTETLEQAQAERDEATLQAAVLREAQHILSHYAKQAVEDAKEVCRFDARLAGLVAEVTAQAKVEAHKRVAELRKDGSITYASTGDTVRPEAFELICERLEEATGSVSPVRDDSGFFGTETPGELALPQLPEAKHVH